MNNPIANLFLQLQDRLKALVPLVRETSEDKGQLEGYELRPPVAFPCVLLDFDFRFDDLGSNWQMGKGDVVLRLAFPPFSQSGNLMPLDVRQKALNYLDIEYEIYKALQGWRPSGFAPLARRSATTERREDTLRVRELRFDTEFEDAGAADSVNTVPKPPLDLDATYD